MNLIRFSSLVLLFASLPTYESAFGQSVVEAESAGIDLFITVPSAVREIDVFRVESSHLRWEETSVEAPRGSEWSGEGEVGQDGWFAEDLAPMDRISVFDEKTGGEVVFVRRQVVTNPMGINTWWGVSLTNANHDLMLTAHGGQLVGTLVDGNGSVRIDGDRSGIRMSAISEQELCGVTGESTIESYDTDGRESSRSSSTQARFESQYIPDGAPIADLLVVYTTDALAEYLGLFPNKSIEVEIGHHVNGVNAAFQGSGIYGGVRLVGIRALDWSITGGSNVNAIRQQFRNANDPVTGVVSVWRDDYGADLVTGVVDTGSTGANGTGDVVVEASSSTSSGAFSVMRLLDMSRTMAHEIAHNAGAGHDRDDSSCDTNPSYRNAFSWPDPTPAAGVVASEICPGEPFTTKMGNIGNVVIGTNPGTPFNTPKIHRFSNDAITITRACTNSVFPRDMYLGSNQPGIQGCTADNERQIERNWAAISDYRPSVLPDHGLSSHNGGETLPSGNVSFTWNPTGVSGSAVDITVWTPGSTTLAPLTQTYTPSFPPTFPQITFSNLPTNEVVALKLDIQATPTDVVSVEYRFNNGLTSVSCSSEAEDFIVNNGGAGNNRFEDASCRPLGTDICTFSATSERWTCDTKQLSVTASSATMIAGFGNGHTYDYAAYGVLERNTGNRAFCCLIRDQGNFIQQAYLYGTEGDDTLRLVDECSPFASPTGGAQTTCGEMSEIDGQPLSVRVYGRGGDDVISGSNRDTDDYIENLRGNAGDDIIMGNGGDDLLYGWANDDYLSGGSGDDLLEGGWENDRLEGGPGLDELRGDNGDDTLISRHDVFFQYDDLFGENGNDALCSDYRRTLMIGSPPSNPGFYNLLWYNNTWGVSSATAGNSTYVFCGDSSGSSFGDCTHHTLNQPPTSCTDMGFTE